MKNNPLFNKYRHALWALYVPLYLVFFFLVEKLVPSTADYWVSYMKLDDMIPFCEYFVVFYVLWYPYMALTGIYLIFKDADAFRRFMWCIIIGFSSSLIFFLIFPNGQDLRPQVFENNNIFTRLVGLLYSSDTNTNVLPSMHVIGSMATFFAYLDCRELRKRKWLVAISLFINIMINLSTVFIKQHSFLDVIAGLAVSAVIYLIVYVFIKRKMMKKNGAEFLREKG
ncbi:MAG: phosphatase PAP2 family protein [Eubacteriales bacterium]